MAPSRPFAFYPGAKEGPEEKFVVEPDSNPALRGIPIVAAGALLSRVGFLQQFFWDNAGFGKIKDLEYLGNPVKPRFYPTVIPIVPTPSPTVSAANGSGGGGADALSLTAATVPDLFARQPADLSGRYYSAADYHALYSSGELTPLQVARAILPLVSRASNEDRSLPYGLAFAEVHPDKVMASARASTERYAHGRPLGLLDGVPVGIKDDVDVEGYVSHNGMRPRPSERFFSPSQGTAPVARPLLEQHGALLIGKLVMHELGADTTGCNPAWGTPRNWHNEDYYPGGSSSGAGSALAAGLVVVAVGTDAGGSIRIPASFGGVYGLKVSHSRTVDMGSTVCVTGPMAATARDLEALYRVMAHPDDDEDPIQASFGPAFASVPPSLVAAEAPKKVIGVPRQWIQATADPAVIAAMDAAIQWFNDAKGYSVVDVSFPYLRMGQLAHAAVCLTEMAVEARKRATRWLDIVNPPNKVLLTVGSKTPAGDWIKYAQLRQLLMQHTAALYEKHGEGLLVLTPTTALRGWRRSKGDDAHGFSDGNVTIKNMNFIWLANFVGCPSVSCPGGYLPPKPEEAAGSLTGDKGLLPMGLMAMAQWGADETLLGFAREAEEYVAQLKTPVAAAEEGGAANPPLVGRKRPAGWVDVIAKAREMPREEPAKQADAPANGNGA